MNKPTIKLNMKLEEPIYIDENTVEVPVILMQGDKISSKTSIMAKFNGQVWQTVENK
jgi:hypothetical protein